MAKSKKTVVKKIDNVEEIDDEEIEDVEEIEEIQKAPMKKEKINKVIDDDDFSDEDEKEYIEITMEERITNIEKKTNYTFIITILTLIVALITMLSVLNNNTSQSENNSSETEQETSSYTYDTSSFKAITANDIKSESKGETIVVLIARQGCSYCSHYAPILAEVAKDYNITVRYIDMATIVDFSQGYITDGDAYDLLAGLEGSGEWEGFAKKYINGTPLTLIIKNNKVIGGVSGYVEASGIETAFENAGIKK